MSSYYCSSVSTSYSDTSSRLMNTNSRTKLSHRRLDKRLGFYEGVCHNPSRRRIVFKNGQINATSRNVNDHRYRLLQSLFVTLVDMQWRYLLLILTSSFFISWLGFALIWWLIALVHGDFDPQNLPPNPEGSDWIPCVIGIRGFTSSFLFSMENQHTTGFGTRVPTEECPEAIFVMCIQAIFGVTIQTAVVGVVLAKMSRPKQRQNTLLFSANAVICIRDGDLCLMIRIGDVQKSNLIGANLKIQFVLTDSIMEDEVVSPFRGLLKINSSMSRFNLVWPEMVVHRIDKDSPLYDLSAEEMIRAKFELVAILEGTLEATNQKIQAMASWVPSNILWGHRFRAMIVYNNDSNSYEVDYNLFDSVYPVDTPICSARDLAILQEEFVSKSTEILDQEEICCGGDASYCTSSSGPRSVATV